MRVLLAAVVAIVAAGCSDPSLTVDVQLPDAYRAQVAQVSLADYELAGLTCDEIAFGDVPSQTLDGALTTQVVITPGNSASLAGVSRVDHKVLVARGLDASGVLVVAGCATLDVVDGDASVTIGTAPAAIATIDQRRPDAALDPQTPITLHVIDPLGKPLGGRVVRWRVYGPKAKPGGESNASGCEIGVDGCTSTGAAGDATVKAVAPVEPGPVLVQIHVEWARVQPGPVAAFTSALSTSFILRLSAAPPPASCVAYRAATGVRIGCLATALGGAIEVHSFGWNGTAIVRLPGSAAAPDAVALVAAPGGGTTDTLIAIGKTGDFVDGTTGAVLGHASFPGDASTAQLVPACGKTAFVVVGFVDGSLGSYGTDASPLTTFVTSKPQHVFELGATGCISDVGAPATTYRAVILTDTNSDQASITLAEVDCPNAACTPTWVGFGGVGFVSGAGSESRLAIGQLDLSGVIVTEWLIDPSAADSAKQLVSPLSHDAVSVPQAIVSGDFDGDGAADRAWLMAGANTARPPGRLEVVLAAEADGVPIAGISPEIKPGPSGVVVARLDDDAIDDFALFSGDELTIVLSGKLAP